MAAVARDREAARATRREAGDGRDDVPRPDRLDRGEDLAARLLSAPLLLVLGRVAAARAVRPLPAASRRDGRRSRSRAASRLDGDHTARFPIGEDLFPTRPLEPSLSGASGRKGAADRAAALSTARSGWRWSRRCRAVPRQRRRRRFVSRRSTPDRGEQTGGAPRRALARQAGRERRRRRARASRRAPRSRRARRAHRGRGAPRRRRPARPSA